MENENNSKRKNTTNTINDFHDDILTHIISFLPIKDAFRTTLLSKRWVLLCRSLPVLHINDDGVKNEKDLIQFRQMLDAVMFSPRSQDSTHKSFKLTCCSILWDANVDCFNMDKWIEAATGLRVEYLYLHLFENPLTLTIFCCKTLVVLHLTDIHVPNMFDCSLHLPLLKILYLFSVRFQDSVDFTKLLYGCPKLDCLSTLFVEPAVTTFEANAGITAEGYFNPLSNLISAVVDVPYKAVSNVKFLSVFGILDTEEINSYNNGFPVFGNLIELQLCWIHGIHDYVEVVKMLQNCPKLQALRIEKVCLSALSTTIENWEYPDHVPKCVSSHLTTCRIELYEAMEADFRFASYILKNARLLQVMTICRTLTPKPIESPKNLEDLSSCPKISPTCKLELI
ncbi:cyclin-like F-box protein [Medicago truncatula]|uniref:Cyclin-like F-box protein n=1 Tax=Medicago truncatula TaxID=3880 RepID=G7IG61_MEDTR|nr:cyclin-like F-box protein [Medicago truncatula]